MIYYVINGYTKDKYVALTPTYHCWVTEISEAYFFDDETSAENYINHELKDDVNYKIIKVKLEVIND
jgi:hypothetical protein